jgi:hypothetical protein
MVVLWAVSRGRAAQVNLLCLLRVGSVRRLVVLTRPACMFWRAWVRFKASFVPCPAPILRKLTHPYISPGGGHSRKRSNKKKQVKKKSACDLGQAARMGIELEAR